MEYPNQDPAAPSNRAAGNQPVPPGGKSKKRSGRNVVKIVLLVAVTGVVILLAAAGGGWAGYRSGIDTRQAVATQVAVLSLEEQFTMALDDLQNERYDIARQRLEYILDIDPGYPQAADRLAEAMSILYATATPTPPLPTITPTPTRDLRPVQDLLTQARSLVDGSNWSGAIDTLLALRKSDPAYEIARVDGMMFISLRQRGFEKIWQAGDLEGGIYDLALAARFGPLDAQAASARELARLYLFGSAFWEVYPEQAVNWFGQVAAAAPGLRDASGWTAAARYAQSLVHYGDQLMAQDPCLAAQQYELATRAGGAAQGKFDEAMLACMPPTNTPKPTEPGETPTATPPVIPTEPVQTTEPPVQTTEPPVQTTEPPVQTTEPPVQTTEPPVQTTEPPVETTEPPPVQTTEPPVQDTEPPPVVTDAPGLDPLYP